MYYAKRVNLKCQQGTEHLKGDTEMAKYTETQKRQIEAARRMITRARSFGMESFARETEASLAEYIKGIDGQA